jgi:heterodisulfide reductase subunit A-like polyferredoxin
MGAPTASAGAVFATKARRVKERMSEGTGTKPMVIVGGGKAGGTAAATLREEGFGGPVVLISREPEIPFGRPPLSKTYLRSEEGLEDWYVIYEG